VPWGVQGGGSLFESFGDTSNRGTNCVASGSINTKGSYTVLTAATTLEAWGIYLYLYGGSATASHLIDIGIGAATEDILIPDLRLDVGNQSPSAQYYFPILVPEGSRLTARVASTVASSGVRICGTLVGPNESIPPPLSVVTAYGVVSASSRGTTIPGNTTTANTEGTETEIVASTSEPMRGFVMAVGAGADITTAGSEHSVCLRQGAATGDVIIDNVQFNRDAGTDIPRPTASAFYPCDVPAATRLSATLSSSSTTAGDRDLDLIVYGVS
jgi:hypothetical protein